MTSKRTKAHTRYTVDGDIVPGVTTILNLLAKPQLIIWANRLGLQGIDSTKYRDEMADIGSLAHAMILADLQGQPCDTADYSAEQIDKAENCYLSWLDWRKGHDVKPLLVETSVCSRELRCGGTLDFLGHVDGVLTLMDYKTGGVYKEAYIQACAYRGILIEEGHPPAERITILGIPRSATESFREVTYGDFKAGWEIFRHLAAIYKPLQGLK